jgi:hypothetical protein
MRAGASQDDATGTSDGAAPHADEPWTRRVAAWTRAFTDGMELRARAARLGASVRDHLTAARWSAVAVGVVVLLFWPSPTLSVLIWVAAVVAFYLWALAWLLDQAEPPAPVVPVAAGAGPALEPEAGGGRVLANGTPVTPAMAVPAPRTTPEPLVPAALTQEAISTLSGRLDLLVRLGAAHDAGVLSDDEFHREKDRLLKV